MAQNICYRKILSLAHKKRHSVLGIHNRMYKAMKAAEKDIETGCY